MRCSGNGDTIIHTLKNSEAVNCRLPRYFFIERVLTCGEIS
jgi:hypothetical protein